MDKWMDKWVGEKGYVEVYNGCVKKVEEGYEYADE